MLLNGTHTCEKCNTTNEWVCHVKEKISDGKLTAFSYPKDKIPVSIRYIKESEYKFSYRCPKCDYLNIFSYNSELYL